MHVPLALAPSAMEQAPHGPQAELQQTPWTQKPELHSADAVHACPVGACGSHTPSKHPYPCAQPAFEAHDVGHVVCVPSHAYAPQLGSPARPSGAAPQVPGDPGTAQLSHAPAQVVLQQYPSTQKPLAQLSEVWQAAPSVARTSHWPLAHQASAAQSRSVAQAVGQVGSTPSHSDGLHAGDPALPVGAVAQVPLAGAPASVEHTWHAPLHAVEQQTPSTQLPLWHWRGSLHAAPTPVAATPAPALQ